MTLHLRGRVLHGAFVFILLLVLALPCVAQSSQPQAKASPNGASEPTATFRSFTRLVTIEVVAKDRHGHHVTGLKPTDFEIYEQSLRDKDKRPQKISGFEEIHFADLAKQSPAEMKVPAGVYTNAVTLTKNPVPPTILMVDGLNTKITDQAQIQVQLEKIIKSIPRNTPVAIFLLGWRLRILQDFSTDPELLKIALKKAGSTATAGLTTGDPLDNANAASAQLEDLRGHESDISGGASSDPASVAINAQIQALADAAQGIEYVEYKATMDHRVTETLQAMTSIAHYVAGYPGRKNLLWISSSFPIKLDGASFGMDDKGYANYEAQIRRAANALSDAKIAVYPVNPAGVQPHAIYGADAVPRNYSGPGMGATMTREIVNLGAQDRSMRKIADETGGEVCNGTNDISECLTKAFDDSSSFYEISYYPDSHDWNGEYRSIIVKTKHSGVHLEYRHGYFAGPAPYEDQKAELQDAACQGYLSSTSVVFAATKLPVQASGELKFYMDVDPQTITLSPTGDGGREFSIQVAACTFDRKGKPLQLLSQALNGKLTPKEYESVAKNGLAHVMSIPAPLPAGVRLVVKDLPSSRVGSVHVNLENVNTPKTSEAKQAATSKKSE